MRITRKIIRPVCPLKKMVCISLKTYLHAHQYRRTRFKTLSLIFRKEQGVINYRKIFANIFQPVFESPLYLNLSIYHNLQSIVRKVSHHTTGNLSKLKSGLSIIKQHLRKNIPINLFTSRRSSLLKLNWFAPGSSDVEGIHFLITAAGRLMIKDKQYGLRNALNQHGSGNNIAANVAEVPILIPRHVKQPIPVTQTNSNPYAPPRMSVKHVLTRMLHKISSQQTTKIRARKLQPDVLQIKQPASSSPQQLLLRSKGNNDRQQFGSRAMLPIEIVYRTRREVASVNPETKLQIPTPRTEPFNLDIKRLSQDVMQRIDKQMRIERQRMGML